MKTIREAGGRLLAAASNLYNREPARCNSYIAGAVVFGLGLVGVVVTKQSVLPDVALVVPILIAGEATRAKVSPIARRRR